MERANEHASSNDGNRKQTSYQNPSFDPKQVYHAEDDAQVCTLVPIKDRRVMFEQLQDASTGSNEEERARGGKYDL